MVSPTTTTNAVLDALERYCLDSPDGTPNRSGEGRTKFMPIVQQKVTMGAPIHLVLPGFPFKSPNSKEKVLGILPDKAEEFALAHLDSLCKSIADLHKPGAELTIISDGLVYNDLLGVPDRTVWAYGQAVRKIVQEKGFKNLKFARLHTMVDTEIDEDSLTEEVYLANAAHFREKLESVVSATEVSEHLASNEDARTTYNGYNKVLTDDLAHSSKSNKEEITAKKMILRGKAFAAAIENTYPESVRLSIHPSSRSNKFSISLFPTRKSTMTPWHTTIAFRLDGSFRTAHREVMEASLIYELVERNQKPWFFRERSDLYSWGIEVEFEPSYPFGLVVTPTPGTIAPSFTDIDVSKLRQLAEYNSPIVLRGFSDASNQDLFNTWAKDAGAMHPRMRSDITLPTSSGSGKDCDTRYTPYLHLKDMDSGIEFRVSSFRISRTLEILDPKTLEAYTSSRAFFDFLPAPYTAELFATKTGYNRYSNEHMPMVVPHPKTGAPCLRYCKRSLQESEMGSVSQEDKDLYDVIENLSSDRRVGVIYEPQAGDIIAYDTVNQLKG